jgi:hypothetical protein
MLCDKPQNYIIFDYDLSQILCLFVLIAKKFFSFHIEFEIILHFMIYYRF